MSFDLLSADLVLKIFNELPFKDCVRLRGVNRLFKDVSEKSINTIRSLVINEDLIQYSIWTQKFSSLLESCSPILESIDASYGKCDEIWKRMNKKWLLIALAEFGYPKLEHIEIKACRIDNEEEVDSNPPNVLQQMKKLISRCPNLRSIVLNLCHQLEWPDDVIFEKLEVLVIHVYGCSQVEISSTLRPMIGKIPNLKELAIIIDDGLAGDSSAQVQEFSHLLASTPDLVFLKLDVAYGGHDFVTALPTWRLPKLTTLDFYMCLNGSNPPSYLQHFPSSFPRLESLISHWITEIDDQALQALSQLKHLRELRLKSVDTREWAATIASAPASSTSAGLFLGMKMTKAQIIDLITNIPSIATLEIGKISDISSPETLLDFLSSTAAIFRRGLEICAGLFINGSESELDRIEAILEEMKNNDESAVACKYWRHKGNANYIYVNPIRYKVLDG